MDDKILALPWQIQLALGVGYAAYLIAYSGIRQHHSSADVFFRTLGFGLIATAILYLTRQNYWALGGAALAPLLFAALWRWKLKSLVKALLRLTDVSWSDDLPNAWLSLIADKTDCRPSQITVDLADGRVLFCEDTSKFADAAYGPCRLGLDGSIAFYVTSERRCESDWIDHSDVIDPFHGDRITYVPANQIKRIDIRYWRKSNATALERAQAKAAAAEASED